MYLVKLLMGLHCLLFVYGNKEEKIKLISLTFLGFPLMNKNAGHCEFKSQIDNFETVLNMKVWNTVFVHDE
jgi:hypothetical protein